MVLASLLKRNLLYKEGICPKGRRGRVDSFSERPGCAEKQTESYIIYHP